jgi:hypothetical protein
LRVLLELTRRQLHHPGGVRISSRDLAEACKASRRNVQYALDSLTKRLLITARQGTATQPATYRVNITDTVRIAKTERIGGAVTTPPPAKGRSRNDATLALFQRHPGVVTTPPPTENTALARAAAASDLDLASLGLIDQILCAKARNFEKEDIEANRHWMQGYMARFGRDETNRPYDLEHAPHPPSDNLVAQFLTVAETPHLEHLKQELFMERKTCYSYGWFVTVALQRCAGLRWEVQKQARAILTEVKRTKRQRQAEQLTIYDDADAGDLRAVVAEAAARKKLG